MRCRRLATEARGNGGCRTSGYASTARIDASSPDLRRQRDCTSASVRRQADGRSRCTAAAPRSTRRVQLGGSESVTSALTACCTEASCAVAGSEGGWVHRGRSRGAIGELGAERGKGRLRKQDKGRRDSRKSPRVLRNPTEYRSCDGGSLRQHARAPASEERDPLAAPTSRAIGLPLPTTSSARVCRAPDSVLLLRRSRRRALRSACR